MSNLFITSILNRLGCFAGSYAISGRRRGTENSVATEHGSRGKSACKTNSLKDIFSRHASTEAFPCSIMVRAPSLSSALRFSHRRNRNVTTSGSSTLERTASETFSALQASGRPPQDSPASSSSSSSSSLSSSSSSSSSSMLTQSLPSSSRRFPIHMSRKASRTRSARASAGSSIVPAQREPPQYQQRAVRTALRSASKRPHDAAVTLVIALAAFTHPAPRPLLTEVVSALTAENAQLLDAIVALVMMDDKVGTALSNKKVHPRPPQREEDGTTRALVGSNVHKNVTNTDSDYCIKDNLGRVVAKTLIFGPTEILAALVKNAAIPQSLAKIYKPDVQSTAPHITERVIDLLRACLVVDQSKLCAALSSVKDLPRNMACAVPISPSTGLFICRLVAARTFVSSDTIGFVPCYKRGLLIAAPAQSVVAEICANAVTPADHRPALVALMGDLSFRAEMIMKDEDPDERDDRHFISYLGIISASLYNDCLTSLNLFVKTRPLSTVLDFALAPLRSECCNWMATESFQPSVPTNKTSLVSDLQCPGPTSSSAESTALAKDQISENFTVSLSSSVNFLTAVLEVIAVLFKALSDSQNSVLPSRRCLAAAVDASTISRIMFDRRDDLLPLLRLKSINANGTMLGSLRLSIVDSLASLLQIADKTFLQLQAEKLQRIRCALIQLVAVTPSKCSVLHCRVAHLFEYSLKNASLAHCWIDEGKIIRELLSSADSLRNFDQSISRTNGYFRVVQAVATALKTKQELGASSADEASFYDRFENIISTTSVNAEGRLFNAGLKRRSAESADVGLELFHAVDATSMASEDFAQELFFRSFLDDVDGITEPTDVNIARAAASSVGSRKSILEFLPHRK